MKIKNSTGESPAEPVLKLMGLVTSQLYRCSTIHLTTIKVCKVEIKVFCCKNCDSV